MAIVKITLIPVLDSKYYDTFVDEEKFEKLRSGVEQFEYVRKSHLKYVIEQLSDFEPRLTFKIEKGQISFESNNWRLDLRILTGASIMEEVEKN